MNRAAAATLRARPRFLAPAFTLVLAGCMTLGGAQKVTIYVKGTNDDVSGPGLSGWVDFERRTFVADIHGQHFEGSLSLNPNVSHFKILPRATDGSELECYLDQLQPELWRGRCQDSQHRFYELRVGATFHI
jgi:hypothetical protein